MIDKYPWSYKVSIRNADTDLMLLESAYSDIEGVVELVHRFLDMSDEDFTILLSNMLDFTIETYMVSGEPGTDAAWMIYITKQPLPEPKPWWKRAWHSFEAW